jgi:ankyrin repeat protein
LAATSTAAIHVLTNRNVVVNDLRDYSERTPLHIATIRRVPLAVLSTLVDNGADLELLADDAGLTCTDTAVASGNAAALRLFLVAGVDVNRPDAEPFLHRLVRSFGPDLPCLILLLAAGADVTTRENNGQTACFLLAAHSRPMMPFVHAMLAAGADLDAADEIGKTPRQLLAERGTTAVDPAQVEMSRLEIAKARLDFVRFRAMDVCIGLQSLQLDALQLCEILVHACGPLAPLISFHQWWKIATIAKHYKH